MAMLCAVLVVVSLVGCVALGAEIESPSAGSLQGDNVCYNEETYTELEQLRTTHPVKIRSYNWCLSFPPRCSNYRTEMKEVLRLQNVTKTRLIEFCCDGYGLRGGGGGDGGAAGVGEGEVGDASTTEPMGVVAEAMAERTPATPTVRTCVPKCRGGCGQGHCSAPNQCTCDVGFEGRHCSQRCRFKMFGPNCSRSCRCRNGALCDHRTGYCRCTAGWIGELCELPCPTGYYGIMCKRFCGFCASGRCDAQTGYCSPADLPPHIIFSTPSNRPTPTARTSISPNIMRIGGAIGHPPMANSSTETPRPTDTMRIKAKHWIAVAGNGKMQLRNCTGNCHPLRAAAPKVPVTSNNTTSTTTTVAPVDGAKLASLIDQTHQHHVRIQQNHTAMMTALNSSIANLTSDVGKLSLQIVEQQQEQQLGQDKVTLILDADAMLRGDERAENSVAMDVTGTQVVGEEEKVGGSDGAVRMQELEVGENDEDGELYNEMLHFVTLQGLNQSADSHVGHMENPPMVPVVLVVLVALILLALIAFGLTYVVRRANGSEPVGQRVTRRAQHVQEIKLSDHVQVQKPLPDIPSFTQSFTRRHEAQAQDFYDKPSNNLSIVSGLNSFGYSYTTQSPVQSSSPPAQPDSHLQSETTAPIQHIESASRKPSLEHIYDEIKYADRQPVSSDHASQR